MLTGSDSRVSARLALDNPWWDTGRVPSPILALPPRAFFERLFERVASSDPGHPLIVTGGRRVGKTTLLHHFAQGLIEAGIGPRRIVYVNLAAPAFAGVAVGDLAELAPDADNPAASGPLYVLLDDCHVRPRWRETVASLGAGSPPAVTVAASAVRDVAPTAAHDAVLPPLTFYEYVHAAEPDRPPVVDPDPAAIAALNGLFLDYLNEGAYPRPPGTPGSERLRLLAADLAGAVFDSDLPQRFGIADTAELARLFAVVAERTAGETGIEELAAAAALAKNTVRRHLDFLEAAHLIVRLPRIEGNAAGFARAVTFKVHLSAPAFRAALFGRAERDDPATEPLTETAVLGQWLHSPSLPRLRFARWRVGAAERSVDLVCVDAGKGRPLWAVDVTWSNRAYADADALAGLAALAPGVERPFPRRITTRTLAGTRSAGTVECGFVPAALYAYGLVRDVVARRTGPPVPSASGSAAAEAATHSV